MKTILMVILLSTVTSIAIAGETSVQAAKKSLNEEIYKVFKSDLRPWNNYFYENDISSVNEKLKVSFYVDENQHLRLLSVKTENYIAKDYVKHVFNTRTFKADELLSGKAFSINLHLIYKAK